MTTIRPPRDPKLEDLRRRRKQYRQRTRNHYRFLLEVDLHANATSPPLLREIGLLRPMRRLVDRWAHAATWAHIHGAREWCDAAAAVSKILHAVYAVATRGDYERLDKPAAWATALLLDLQIAQPYGPRAVRERAVREHLARVLRDYGLSEKTPGAVVGTWARQFPEELNLIDHIWDLEAHMCEHFDRDLNRYETMLGDRSMERCRETAVTLVRLLLRHPMWPKNKSKNYLKADIVQSSRVIKKRRAQQRSKIASE